MEVTGKIILKLPLAQGTSKAGNPWRKQEYVLETLDTYPKKVHFDFFGDRIDQFPLEVGNTVTVSFDIESREFNGRWYTDIRAWKSEPAKLESPAAAPAAPAAAPAPQDVPIAESTSEDDLPF